MNSKFDWDSLPKDLFGDESQIVSDAKRLQSWSTRIREAEDQETLLIIADEIDILVAHLFKVAH